MQLPIDTAMELVVNDYQTKAVGPSQVKVDNPYPYGLQLAVRGPGSFSGNRSRQARGPVHHAHCVHFVHPSCRQPGSRSAGNPQPGGEK